MTGCFIYPKKLSQDIFKGLNSPVYFGEITERGNYKKIK